MKSFIKKLTATFGAVLLMAMPAAVVVPSVAHASNVADNVCAGISSTEGDTLTDCSEEGDNSFGTIARRVINIFSIVVGAISVIMIIIGGFRYIISGGDQNGVSGAKNTILYAIVGLVIVLFAQIIVRFVFSNASTTTT